MRPRRTRRRHRRRKRIPEVRQRHCRQGLGGNHRRRPVVWRIGPCRPREPRRRDAWTRYGCLGRRRRCRQPETGQMSGVVWAAAVVAALGVLFGLATATVLRRRASSPEQASRRSRAFSAYCMLLLAAVLLFAGITEEHRRYLNIGIAAVMVVIAIWQLRNVKRQTRESP